MIEINGTPAPEGTLAVSLAADGRVVVWLPGKRSEGHTIKLAPDANGMLALVRILTQRQLTPDATISGQMDAPTQSIVEAWLRQNSPAGRRESVQPARSENPLLSPSETDALLSEIGMLDDPA